MGCDIHICLEVKEKDYSNNTDNTFHWVNKDLFVYEDGITEDDRKDYPFYRIDCYEGRNYRLFGRLCGVRYLDDEHQISEPRGYPSNVHKITLSEINAWEGDGHNHSWNTLSELRASNYSFPNSGLQELIEGIETRIKYLDYHVNQRTPPEEIRIVYWFDN